MVFGNLGPDSGTGVAFTRDPGSGAQGVYGDYLQNAQGEDVVAGIRNTVPLADLKNVDEPAYDELLSIMSTLESHYRDLCDIEFTIERNKLWMLQTRVGNIQSWSTKASSTWTRRSGGSPATSWPS
jgi:pyruvate,orthophosphate dikinase